MLATGSNPSLQLGKAPDHPPPVPVYGDKWVLRTYDTVKTATTTGAGVQFLNSSFGVLGSRYFVDKIQVWKLGLSSAPNGDQGLLATFKQGLFTDLGDDDVQARDYGTGTSLAGVTCKVPLGHAKGVATSGTSVLVECSAAVGNASTESFVCHLTAWVPV